MVVQEITLDLSSNNIKASKSMLWKKREEFIRLPGLNVFIAYF